MTTLGLWVAVFGLIYRRSNSSYLFIHREHNVLRWRVREIKINVYLNGANLDRYKDSNIEILAPQTSVELLFLRFEFKILVILLWPGLQNLSIQFDAKIDQPINLLLFCVYFYGKGIASNIACDRKESDLSFVLSKS